MTESSGKGIEPVEDLSETLKAYAQAMMKLLLVFAALGFLVGLVVRSLRAALAGCLVLSGLVWIVFVAVSDFDIPINEPEWWGGLALTCTALVVGGVIGQFTRTRSKYDSVHN